MFLLIHNKPNVGSANPRRERALGDRSMLTGKDGLENLVS